MKTETNNEQLILEAAEAEFLEKGYSNTKTTAIAKRAGVTHAMLHYYFRTKEKLFQKVFQNKVRLVGDSFYQDVNENLSFEETIRKFIESHFDFISRNPKLLNFVYNEVVINKENRRFLLDQIHSKVGDVMRSVDKLLSAEILKGTVRPVKIHDLFINIAAMNAVTFMVLSVAEDLIPGENTDFFDHLIRERKESNVQFVLNALKI